MKFKTHGAFRRVASVGLTAIMGATFIAGQVFAFADNGSSSEPSATSQSLAFENANGKVNLTDIKMSNMTDKAVLNTEYANVTRTLIVSLKGQALSEMSDPDEADRAAIAQEQKGFLRKLRDAGISYAYKSSYSTLLNAVAIDVKLSDAAAIKAIDGVDAVTVGSTYSRPKAVEASDGAQKNYSGIYANGIYDSSAYLDDKADGSGMTVAILDTGLDYTHEAFAPEFKDEGKLSFTAEYVENTIKNTTAQSDKDPVPFHSLKAIGATADDVYINKKVPFAFDYADRDADVYPSYSQHGTHVAGIVAGKADGYVDKDGKDAVDADGNPLSFRGVAPEAQLVICKVFSDDLDNTQIGGAETVDILDALEDCYNLNVDVINMSLGTSAGFSSSALGFAGEEKDSEGYMMARVYKNIRDKGISLIVAASNEFSAGYGSAFGTNLATNPDSGTVGSPSTFTGALSVASVNGQYASYMLANADIDGSGNVSGGTAVYYEESRNEDSDAYNFLDSLLGCKKEGCTDGTHIKKGMHDPANYKEKATFKYVVVPGKGEAPEYTQATENELRNKKIGDKEYEGVIALVQRGSNSFKEKIMTAREFGADAVIVYNNVSGLIRMSLEDMNDDVRIPSASVSLEVGNALKANRRTVGTITLDRSYLAGPFMNDYSSWGCTPDLKLKPDITSHGGEITSTVAGGYAEQSGTSMASPNMAGFTALVKSYLKNNYEGTLWTNANELTKLTNNITMSTATIVYDQNKLPYSPRKQGAGLGTLKNIFGLNSTNGTQAYLYTDETDGMCEDGRPKAELGDDRNRTTKGKYDMVFYVRNFGNTPLTFTTNSIFMTESLGEDGKSVAEKAHLFTDENGKTVDATWKVGGQAVAEGGQFTVAADSSMKIEVSLQLTAIEMRYLETTFKNGMFVEGFLQLKSSGDQCDLNFPFMGFYGDWRKAPMMDLTCFDVAADAKDTSKKEEERRQPSVWATQAYSYYYNERYDMPLGGYAYLQDPAKEHTDKYVYVEEEHISISRFNEYEYEGSDNNYLTTTGIRALYAGLLRNAELVTYKLTNVDTGEVIPDENGNAVREIYRVGKAYAGGGTARPALVPLEMRTEELGVEANGKYNLSFEFYFNHDDEEASGTFSMNFYVDYEAPVLVDSRLRFQDRKDENNKVTQSVYLDLDIFDNHYPQAVILCYQDGSGEDATLRLATDYITPVINPKKNTVNTVSINITDFYDDYKSKLYVELDDYALNHNVYSINLNHAQSANASDNFTVMAPDSTGKLVEVSEVTVKKNETVTLSIGNIGNGNVTNYSWSCPRERIARVKNGQIFGVSVGDVTVHVTGKNGAYKDVLVHVVEGSDSLSVIPSVSFGTIRNADDAPVKAAGTVAVNPAQKFTLNLVSDPWYFDLNKSDFIFESSDPEAVSIDANGNVVVNYEEDTRTLKQVLITAEHKTYATCKTEVTLTIRNPFTVSNGTLTRYRGWGGKVPEGGTERVLKIPSDKSITVIGSEAFKDIEGVQVVIIPKAVTTINELAFEDCKSLTKICFIDEEDRKPEKSSLNIIMRNAFQGCTSLKTVDLTNCKVITLDRNVFTGCTALEEIVYWNAIGTAYPEVFAGCTSLKTADISKLHIAGARLFTGCTSLNEVITGQDTALSTSMFSGCTALEDVEINCSVVPANAFAGCTALKTVKIAAENTSIGAGAFTGCSRLTDVTVTGSIKELGNGAFRNCVVLKNAEAIVGADTVLGSNVFENVTSAGSAVIMGSKLVKAAATVSSTSLDSGVTEIGSYAFSGSKLSGVNTIDLTGVTKIGTGAFYGLTGLTQVTIPDGVTEIPDYAFYGTGITEVTIPASVTKIGAYAFGNSTALYNVTWNSALKEIGNSAFTRTAITELALPASVTTIGDEAFARCSRLESVDLPSVTSMGEAVFLMCPSLTTAKFGEEATTTGTYTFMDRVYSYDYTSGSLVVTERVTSVLTTVELGDKIERIGTGAFIYSVALQTIDLNNATIIGDEAFSGCTKLATVTGLSNVTEIGQYAFAECKALRAVDLSSAVSILYAAFRESGMTSLVLGNGLMGVGDDAFAGHSVAKITIPASCEYVGPSAFSGTERFLEFEVEEGNLNYFADGGALYRYIYKYGENVSETYEFCAYPNGKMASVSDGARTFEVKEDTVAIGAYAFAGISENMVTAVKLPYSVKTIGTGAFLGSGITTYRFESITAPTLLERYTGRTIEKGSLSSGSYFYNNFSGEEITITLEDGSSVTRPSLLVDFVPWYPGDNSTDKVASNLQILYPSNGTGYDNYIYSNYFGSKVSLGELPDDNARALKKVLDTLTNAAVVSGWNSSNTSKEYVTEFANTVKNAHMLYNGIKSEVQLAHVGQENIDKLFAVEAALKPVKQAFGIPVRVRSIAVSPDSTHKTQYVAGERFSLNGLKVLVTYDDYSQSVLDAKDAFVLDDLSDRPLRATDESVTLAGSGEFDGRILSVKISVAEGNGEAPKGLPTVAIVMIILACVAVLAAAGVAATVIVLKKKRAPVAVDEDYSDNAETNGEDGEEHLEKETEEDNGGDEKTDD